MTMGAPTMLNVVGNDLSLKESLDLNALTICSKFVPSRDLLSTWGVHALAPVCAVLAVLAVLSAFLLWNPSVSITSKVARRQ